MGGCTICFFSMFSATRAFEGYLGPTVSSGVAAYCEARWRRGASGTACLTRADMTCDETMAGVAQAGIWRRYRRAFEPQLQCWRFA